MIRLIRRKAAPPPGPVALDAPVTPEEEAWWRVEKRRHMRRAFAGSVLTWAIPMTALDVVSQWRAGRVPLPGDADFPGFAFGVLVRVAIAGCVWFGMTWPMNRGILKAALLRQRRVRDALLAPPDEAALPRSEPGRAGGA